MKTSTAIAIALIAGSAIIATPAMATEAPSFTIRADVASSYSGNKMLPAVPQSVADAKQTWLTASDSAFDAQSLEVVFADDYVIGYTSQTYAGFAEYTHHITPANPETGLPVDPIPVGLTDTVIFGTSDTIYAGYKMDYALADMESLYIGTALTVGVMYTDHQFAQITTVEMFGHEAISAEAYEDQSWAPYYDLEVVARYWVVDSVSIEVAGHLKDGINLGTTQGSITAGLSFKF